MPVLNARPFLSESIGSILSQSFRNFELIVVDNGSTDGSMEFAASLPDPRIRVISEARPGTAHAINAGIAASTAPMLAVLDADDIAAPERLFLQYSFMRENPDTILLGAGFSFIIGKEIVPVAPPLVRHSEIRQSLLQGFAPISAGSSMFRAAEAKSIGGHCLNGPAHDVDFFLRMSEIGKCRNLPVTLHYYRMHSGSSTASTTAIITEHKMFAVACAIARAEGVPEPIFADFHETWRKRPLLIKLRDRARDLSGKAYRRAILQRASGKRFSSGLGFLCSAALNPGAAIWRIKRQLSVLTLQTPAARTQ
ncbi:MAG: glycosyltransferase [Acidobacteriota bacterium]|nr:glycosyltransferase [Acidobacteriota bacterium]